MITLADLRTEDPFHLLERARTKLHTRRLRATYPFARFGNGNSIDYRVEIRRSMAHRIIFGDRVYLAQHIWLNVIVAEGGPAIVLGDRCAIGRGTIIASKNRIELEDDVLIAPGAYITDHPHEYSDPRTPINAQGVGEGGTVRIEKGCWLGTGCVIYSGKGELVLGRNCVVGANAVVSKSFPAYSVIAGNPAKVIKRLDPERAEWVKANGPEAAKLFSTVL